MAQTIENIIKDCVQRALGLPRDEIQNDVFERALAAVNDCAQRIWDSWPWDNTKIDEFTAPASDADGIITFASNIDSIRAVRSITDAGEADQRIWNESELRAAVDGKTVSSDRFIHIADSSVAGSEGCRRIRVSDPDLTYKVLCTKRFTAFTVNNYTTITFPIDRAEQALKEFICDDLRVWAGEAPKGEGGSLLQLAVLKETSDQDRDAQIVPREPLFDEVGNWY